MACPGLSRPVLACHRPLDTRDLAWYTRLQLRLGNNVTDLRFGVVWLDLTGPNAPVTPMTEGTCHPSIAGKGYNVALIESQTVRSEDVSSDHAPFFYSITPVVSVFYKSGSDPKAYMSCLKVVDEDATSGSGGGVVSTQTSNGASRVGPSNMALLSLAWAMLGLGVVIRVSGWV